MVIKIPKHINRHNHSRLKFPSSPETYSQMQSQLIAFLLYYVNYPHRALQLQARVKSTISHK